MNKIFWIILFLAGLVAPFVIYPVFVMKLLCFALFACAFNLLLGYVGLLSFGHAAFFGGAAYLAGYMVKHVGLTPELGILAGTVAAGLMGLAFGFVAIRRQGIYFAMITLALAQVVYFAALKSEFTGGEDGLQGIPRGFLFGVIDLTPSLHMYYFVFALFCLGFWIIYRTVHSPFGEILKAIKENEPRAISLGFKTERYKLLAFVISATLAGLAGATKALVFQLASLSDVYWHTSGEAVLMTLLGGMGTILGPVVGSFTIVTLNYKLGAVGSWVEVIIGSIFVVCVMVFRQGFVGEIHKLVRRKRSAAEALKNSETVSEKAS